MTFTTHKAYGNILDVAKEMRRPYLITPRGMLYPQDIRKSNEKFKGMDSFPTFAEIDYDRVNDKVTDLRLKSAEFLRRSLSVTQS